MPSRRLEDLDPRFRPVAERVLSEAAAAGIPCRVVMTLRTAAEQDALYALGRTKPGAIVTNAKSGQSPHECGLAMDVVPEALAKIPGWIPTSPLWARLGAIVRACGAEWGGDWSGKKIDRPHVQAAGWKALRVG